MPACGSLLSIASSTFRISLAWRVQLHSCIIKQDVEAASQTLRRPRAYGGVCFLRHLVGIDIAHTGAARLDGWHLHLYRRHGCCEHAGCICTTIPEFHLRLILRVGLDHLCDILLPDYGKLNLAL